MSIILDTIFTPDTRPNIALLNVDLVESQRVQSSQSALQVPGGVVCLFNSILFVF